jgi:hypothetical protein
MASQWYYSRNGQKEGPVASEKLKELATSGQITPTNLVWKEGMAQWAKAGSIKGLFPETANASPPPVPVGAASGPPPIPATAPSPPSIRLSIANPQPATVAKAASSANPLTTSALSTPKSSSTGWSKVAGGIASVLIFVLVLLGKVATHVNHNPALRTHHAASQSTHTPQQMEQMRSNEVLAAYSQFTETVQDFMSHAAQIDATETIITTRVEANQPYGDSLEKLIAANERVSNDANVLLGFCNRALLGSLAPDAREDISQRRGNLMAMQAGLATQHDLLKQIESQLNAPSPDLSVVEANWAAYSNLREQMLKD